MCKYKHKLYSYTNIEIYREVEANRFCCGARTYMTVLKANPQNTRSGAQRQTLAFVLKNKQQN